MSTPILSSRFFKDNKPTSALYQKWRGTYPWSHQCLPVYEWDGVLFIGCLQIPTDFPESIPETKVVFVLCEPEALKSCWHEFEGTVASTVPFSTTFEGTRIPAQLETEPTPIEQSAEQFSIDAVDHSLPSFDVDLAHEKLTSPQIQSENDDPSSILIADVAENAEEPAAELPEELVAAEEAAPVEAIAEEPQVPTELAPEGLIFDAKIEAPKFDADVIKTMTSIKIDRSESKAKVSEEPAAEAKLKKAVPAKTEIIYTKPGALSSNRELAEKHEITRTGASVSGIHRTANKLAEVVANVFTEMAYHYQKSMILLTEKEEARPWKWSETFTAATSINSISFTTPNPFRIVSRTQKSYHGYVVPNESNDKFFEEWNEAKTPDHLTVSPILIEEDLVGFLIGFGDKSADNKNSLMLCEKLASDLSVQIKRDPLLLKAA